MKKIATTWAWIGILAIILTHQVRADMIVDTGTPIQSSSDLVLNSVQGWAAQFSTNQGRLVQSIEGFINADTGNPDNATFTIALYGNGADDLPDTNDELFSQQALFTGDGWNGLQGLNFTLNAGTYWVAFEVRLEDEIANRSADTLQGLMPVFAPNPLLKTAYSDTGTNFGYTLASGANNYDIGVRMVPAPPILLMLVPGLLALGQLRKHQLI